MATLMQAHNQWRDRPEDERYTSLTEMRDYFRHQKSSSRVIRLQNRGLKLVPKGGEGMAVVADGHEYAPNHWSFGQLANLGDAPSSYVRTLPPDLAAKCVNHGLHERREVEELSVLLRADGRGPEFASANGPNFGRVWNADILDKLIGEIGDGASGDGWRVPGEFGKAVTVTKENTTLFGSDRSMFLFLADEKNRISVPKRRGGKAGEMARGFFLWNSEVGHLSLGVAFFLFDYVCCNRIVWGAEGFQEITVRHTSGAPERWYEEVAPTLEAFYQSSMAPVEAMLAAARARKIPKVEEFMAAKFSKQAPLMLAAFERAEGRKVETLWDAATAATEFAKTIKTSQERVRLERMGGEVLKLAA